MCPPIGYLSEAVHLDGPLRLKSRSKGPGGDGRPLTFYRLVACQHLLSRSGTLFNVANDLLSKVRPVGLPGVDASAVIVT
jgi:hypothetical protein